jgi:hypothetical protein
MIFLCRMKSERLAVDAQKTGFLGHSNVEKLKLQGFGKYLYHNCYKMSIFGVYISTLVYLYQHVFLRVEIDREVGREIKPGAHV